MDNFPFTNDDFEKDCFIILPILKTSALDVLHYCYPLRRLFCGNIKNVINELLTKSSLILNYQRMWSLINDICNAIIYYAI